MSTKGSFICCHPQDHTFDVVRFDVVGFDVVEFYVVGWNSYKSQLSAAAVASNARCSAA